MIPNQTKHFLYHGLVYCHIHWLREDWWSIVDLQKVGMEGIVQEDIITLQVRWRKGKSLTQKFVGVVSSERVILIPLLAHLFESRKDRFDHQILDGRKKYKVTWILPHASLMSLSVNLELVTRYCKLGQVLRRLRKACSPPREPWDATCVPFRSQDCDCGQSGPISVNKQLSMILHCYQHISIAFNS